ncbi:MAG: HAMP domain-containing protein [Firmicutes bacterium]|nr:HAMP domain-containing protein [Bacillota bacterium]
MKSIKTRLLLVILAIIIISMGSITFLNYRTAAGLLTGETEESGLKLARLGAQNVSEWLSARLVEMNFLASMPAIQSMDWSQQGPYLRAILPTLGNYEMVVIAGPDGTYRDPLEAVGNIGDEEYFKKALSGTPYISDVVSFKSIGGSMIAIAVPINGTFGAINGVLVGLISLKSFAKIIADIKLGETGQSYLVGGDGSLIAGGSEKDAHLRGNLLESKDARLASAVKEMVAGKSGIARYSLSPGGTGGAGSEMMLVHAPVPNTSWSLALTVPEHEITHEARKLASSSLMLVVVGLLATFIVVLLLTSAVARPILAIKDQLAAIAAGGGDLTKEIRVKSSDETGQLAGAFNQFVGSLRGIIRQSMDIAGRVAASGEQLSASMDEAVKSTQQIAASIEQVAKGATEQSAAAQATSGATSEMGGAIAQIARGAEEQAAGASEAVAVVEDMVENIHRAVSMIQEAAAAASANDRSAAAGSEAVSKVVANMSGIEKVVADAASRINQLGEQSQQIGTIIEVIDDIAERTNLLALNAAIEAARAGEHGRGFAVVADEVRKLAERSSRATKEIAGLLSHITGGIQDAVKAMVKGTEEVRNGSALARDAGKALEAILDVTAKGQKSLEQVAAFTEGLNEGASRVSKAVDRIASIARANLEATRAMARNSERVEQDIANIAAISEESAAAAEEVSASVAEMTASINEVAAAAKSLAQLSEELRAVANQFTV